MKLAILRRLDLLEQPRVPRHRKFLLWRDVDETEKQVKARINAQIASGEASEADEFLVLQWQRAPWT